MFNPLTRKRHRRQRTTQISKRKFIFQLPNNWFLVSITLLSWCVVGFIVSYIEPDLIKDIILPHAYLPFFLPLFIGLIGTVYLISSHPIRSFLYSITIITILYLIIFQLAYFWNLFVIFLALVAIEILFLRTPAKTNTHPQSYIAILEEDNFGNNQKN